MQSNVDKVDFSKQGTINVNKGHFVIICHSLVFDFLPRSTKNRLL